jgi:DNA repair exonuclease SbcCD nuclease subunit
MSRIFLTGDIHGEIDVRRLNTTGFYEQKELTKDDYLIILGDFGLIWNNSKEEKYWLKWLKDKPFTTLFIDGNHENHPLLNSYEVKEWNGGKVHFINDSIIHLMRGQVFEINGKSFFTMGGASSVDKEHRKIGISWWEEEIPTYAEFDEGIENLQINNWKVDYVLTHTCSSITLNEMADKLGFQPKPEDAVNKYLDFVSKNVTYKHWFFGHFHINANFNNNVHCMYYDIVEI